jgi:catechol 2,3-dioxygenase-like lactoylglutathione lyase family enzyme
MLDHISITVSDIATAELFYDAIVKVLGVVKVGRRDDGNRVDVVCHQAM